MEQRRKQIRVLMANVGLDGHERGAWVVAAGLRDNGMEVIYGGIHQTPETVTAIALQEDVDVVGLSCHSGVHKYHWPRVIELLKEKGLQEVLVIGGGIISDADKPFLIEKGVKQVFGPGSTIRDITNFIRENVKR